MTDAFIREDFLTDEDVCEILKIKPSTLASRRSCGTNHPPYIEIGKVRWYPKAMFIEWMKKQPVLWEVKGVRRAEQTAQVSQAVSIGGFENDLKNKKRGKK